MQQHHPLVRITAATILALFAVSLIAYGILSFMRSRTAPTAPVLTETDEQKLAILQELKTGSSSVDEQSETLRGLSATSSVSTSQQQKLDILKALQKK